MRSILAIAAAAAAIFVLAPVSAQASGDQCYPALSATGDKEHSQGHAMAEAMEAWEHAADKKYGDDYKDWDWSGDRTIACKWNTAGTKFTCTATARPCGK